MSSKTKIVVLKMKEIIYTAIFIGFAILLVTLLMIMFRPKREESAVSSSAAFVPGVYTASLTVGSQNVNVEVAVDEERINSISFVSLDDSVATMYPLMEPCLDTIAQQICEKQSLEDVVYPDENKYTSQLLLQAVAAALEKAQLPEPD